MKNVKKNLTNGLLLFMMSFFIWGCGNSDEDIVESVAVVAPVSETEKIPLVKIEDLVPGGFVLYFRHEIRNVSAPGIDQIMAYVDRNGICIDGTQLTQEGMIGSITLGEVFRHYKINTDKIYTSPSCRTKQMAMLALNNLGEVTHVMGREDLWTAEEKLIFPKMFDDIMSSIPAPGKNNIIFSHGGINTKRFKAIAYNLSQGDAGVWIPVGNDFKFVGVLKREEWINK